MLGGIDINININRKLGLLSFLFLLLSVTSSSYGKSTSGAKKKSKTNLLNALSYKTNDSEKSSDKKALMTEMLVRRSERMAIKQLKRLLKRHKGQPMEAQLWHRLSELYMRRAKGDRNVSLHRHSQYAVSVAPELIKKVSHKRFVYKAIDVYQKIQRKFKKFSQMDLVVFNSAFAHQMLGKKKESERLYWKLVKEFPNSSLVPDCHLAIGEIAFDQKRFKFALEHFQAVKKYPESRVYPYSVYKAGWTHYNLRDAIGAMKEMEEVVKYGRYVAKNNIDARLDLRKEALADMTIFFEDVLPSSRAYSYFTEQAGDLDVTPILLRLSNIYNRHSRYNDRIVVLEDLKDKVPLSDFIPQIHNDLVDNYESMRDRRSAVAALSDLDALCKPGTVWYNHHIKNVSKSEDKKIGIELPKQIVECQGLLKETSLRLASKWLRMWRKNQTHPIFADSAERSFEMFLGYDDRSKKSNEARIAYADLLFKRKKYRKASENYGVVGAQKNLQGEMGHDARYAALLSLEKAVNDKWSDEDEAIFIAFVDNYILHHKNGRYRLDVEFKKGLIAYEKERYDEAAVAFLSLGDRYGKTAKGKRSQDLYLDILNIKKNYPALKAYAKRLIAGTKSPIRTKKLAGIYQQSYFLEIQEMESKGQKIEAALEYQKFARENNQSKLAPKAWWNSVQIQYQAGSLMTAANSALQYYKRYPKENNSIDGLLKAAQTYEELVQLELAAEVLELLAVKDVKAKYKWLFLAGDFYYLSNQFVKSATIYKKLSVSTDSAIAARALEGLRLLNGKDSMAHGVALIKLDVEPQASLAHLRELKKMEKEGNDSKTFSRARKLLSRKNAPLAVKAEARYIQALILEREFRKQSVKSKVERVALVLSLKTEKLEKTQRAYEAVIRYGQPHLAVRSLVQLADCYSDYGLALKQMPIPSGLPKAEEAGFRAEIEKIAIPIEDKGLDVLLQALTESKRLKLRTGVVSEIQRKINKMNFVKNSEPINELVQPGLVVPVFAKVGK